MDCAGDGYKLCHAKHQFDTHHVFTKVQNVQLYQINADQIHKHFIDAGHSEIQERIQNWEGRGITVGTNLGYLVC